MLPGPLRSAAGIISCSLYFAQMFESRANPRHVSCDTAHSSTTGYFAAAPSAPQSSPSFNRATPCRCAPTVSRKLLELAFNVCVSSARLGAHHLHSSCVIEARELQRSAACSPSRGVAIRRLIARSCGRCQPALPCLPTRLFKSLQDAAKHPCGLSIRCAAPINARPCHPALRLFESFSFPCRADLRQDAHRQDHYAGGGVFGHHRQRQG